MEFKVTNAIVQQAAETGGVQLVDGPELPTASDFLEEEMEKLLKGGALREVTDGKLIEQATILAANRARHAGRSAIANASLEIYKIATGNSPFVPETAPFNSYHSPSDKNEALDLSNPLNTSVLRFHQDNLHNRWGFSILWSLRPIPGEELVVAGRGDNPEYSSLVTYPYTNGPVLIAQKGFGQILVGPEKSRNAAWHRGQRREMGFLGLADTDFREPLLRKQSMSRAKSLFGTQEI